MSCKGCASRKIRLQRWLRGLIAAASEVKTDIALARITATADIRNSSIENKINEMMRQHNVLDRASSEWLMKLEAQGEEVLGRMKTLRALNKDAKNRIRELAVMVEQNERGLIELANVVENIEFPAPQPVEHRINTKA